MLSRIVAGSEKVWIGFFAAWQAYFAAVDWLVEPEKALVVGLIGLAQIWLGTNTDTKPVTTSNNNDNA